MKPEHKKVKIIRILEQFEYLPYTKNDELATLEAYKKISGFTSQKICEYALQMVLFKIK